MQITLIHNDNLITISVSPDATIASLLSIVESESSIPYNRSTQSIQLNYAGNIISNNTNNSLAAFHIQDNDVIEISLTPKQSPSSANPPRLSPHDERAMLEMALLEQALDDDPMNPELQQRLENIIKRKNIQDNIESAMENNPESFARVIMLYVPIEVNNQQLTAFVDSGAQSTIMSLELARRCDLEHLIDTRFAGMAIGVGTQPIIGRVHSAKIKIGDAVLVCSFTILKESSIDLLLGLDQLKRHAMSINLSANCLELYNKKVSFLSEHQLPQKYRKSDNVDPDMNNNNKSTTSTSNATGHVLGSSNTSNNTPSTQSRTSAQVAAASAALARHQQSNDNNNRSSSNTPVSSQPSTVPNTNTSTMTPQQQLAWLASLMAVAAQPQQQQSTQPHSSNQSSTAPATQHSADKINSLTALGFSQAEVVQALNATNGDVDQAASILMG